MNTSVLSPQTQGTGKVVEVHRGLSLQILVHRGLSLQILASKYAVSGGTPHGCPHPHKNKSVSWLVYYCG